VSKNVAPSSDGKRRVVSSRILESMGGIDTDKFNKFLEVGRKLDSTRI
jgi:hypothetical protein